MGSARARGGLRVGQRGAVAEAAFSPAERPRPQGGRRGRLGAAEQHEAPLIQCCLLLPVAVGALGDTTRLTHGGRVLRFFCEILCERVTFVERET